MKKQVKKAVTMAQEENTKATKATQEAQTPQEVSRVSGDALAQEIKPAQVAKAVLSDLCGFLEGAQKEHRSINAVVRTIFEYADAKGDARAQANIMAIAGLTEWRTDSEARKSYVKAVKECAQYVTKEGVICTRKRVGENVYTFAPVVSWSVRACFARPLRRSLGVKIKRQAVTTDEGHYYDAAGKRRNDMAQIAREMDAWKVEKARQAVANAEKRLAEAESVEGCAVILDHSQGVEE